MFVLVAVLTEGLSLVIVIVVDVPEVRSAGQGAISMLSELRSNVQEAKKFQCGLVNSTSQKSRVYGDLRTHCFFFNSFSDALNDILDDGDMVAIRFIITKPHHSPSRQDGIPMDFDNAVINLFARFFEPIQKHRKEKKLRKSVFVS